MENLKQACSSLHGLCDKLFSSTPINYFSYGVMDKNRNLNFVTSDYDLAEYYLDHEHYNTQFQNKSFEEIEVGNLFLSASSTTAEQSHLREQISSNFGIGNLFGIYQRQGDEISFFTFGCDVKNVKAITYFLNNTNFLKEYSATIQAIAKNLININELPPIHVTYKECNKTINDEETKIIIPKGKQLRILANLLVQAKSNRKSLQLSNRELQCLEHILIGNGSSKEVARQLHISPRTAEHHIANLKTKLGCKKKSELRNIFSNTF